MRRRSLCIAVALGLVLSLTTVVTAVAAPRHDKSVFRSRFMVNSDGSYYPKLLGLTDWFTYAGKQYVGEIHFKEGASGKFDVVGEQSQEEGGTRTVKCGTGRAYVTKSTIIFKFNRSSNPLFKIVKKPLTSGRKYYYKYRPTNSEGYSGTLRLYKTKSRFYRAFAFGIWG